MCPFTNKNISVIRPGLPAVIPDRHRVSFIDAEKVALQEKLTHHYYDRYSVEDNNLISEAANHWEDILGNT